MLLLYSCRSPLQSPDQRPHAAGSGRITVSISGSGRTVVPDFQSQVASVTVTLSSNDGYAAPAPAVAAASPWTVSFSDVRAGSWNVGAVAKDSLGNVIGSGTAANRILTPGGALAVLITIGFSSAETTGKVSFTVSFPASTGIDVVVGTLLDGETNPTSSPVIDTETEPRTAAFTFDNIAGGTYAAPAVYPLTLTFLRETVPGETTVAGVFTEQVEVVGGFTSGSWITSDGSLTPVRAFALGDFFSTNSSLADLVLSDGALPDGAFSSGITSYAQGAVAGLAATVTFTATPSITGQFLQYSWNGGALTTIAPDTESPALTITEDTMENSGGDNTLVVKVTAPDRQTTGTYTVRFSKGYTVRYDGNGNTGGDMPEDSAAYEAGASADVLGNTQDLVRSGFVWSSWNTNPDESGTVVTGGSSIPIDSGDITLYADWSRWTNQFGVSGSIVRGYCAGVDAYGNSYVAGSTNGALPGQTLSGAGSTDAFVVKRGPAGNVIWIRQFGGGASGSTTGTCMFVDETGTCYVAGYTDGSLPGHSVSGLTDAFLRTYDADGNMEVDLQYGLPGVNIRIAGISVDQSGNSYAAGYTDGALPGCSQNGMNDACIIKFDPAGGILWARQIGGGESTNTQCKGIATDTSENCYLTGYTNGVLPGQTLTGTTDAFIVKIDATGGFLWARQFGAGANTQSNGISMDVSGNCSIAGYTQGSLPNPSGHGFNTLIGSIDVFVRKYDTAGTLLWTSQTGFSGVSTQGFGIRTDAYGDCYVTGYTQGAFAGQTKTGTYDAFVAKFRDSAYGELLWGRQTGAAGVITRGSGMAMDAAGNCFVTGYTSGSLPGQTLNGTTDAYVTTLLNERTD